MVNTTQIKQDVQELTKERQMWQIQREKYRGVTKEQFTDMMKEQFNSLFENSKTLFDKCLSGDLNMNEFNYMLTMLDKVNAGNDFQAVSQEVGQKLVDIYVKPLLDKEKDTEGKN